MTRETLAALNDHQAAIVAPEIQRLAEIEQAHALQKKRLVDMLSLIEPRMADPAYGFDLKTLRFYRVESPAEEPVS